MATLAIFWQHAGAWAAVQRLRIRRLGSSRFVRNVGTLSGGTALGHLFTIAAGPFLTRIYSPTEFGTLGLFTSFLSIAAVAGTMQYEVSIVSGHSDAEAEYLTLASLLLAVPTSVIAGLVLWFLKRFSILGFGGLPGGTPVLLALTMMFVAVFMALRYWCLRAEHFQQVSRAVLVQNAGRSVLQTAFGAVGFHPMGLLFGEAAGRCLGMSRMLQSAWPVLRSRVRAFRSKEFFEALLANRKFPLYSLPSSLLDALCLGLTVPLLVRFYGSSVGGHYALVWRVIALPGVLVTLAVADTFHARIATCARETPHKVRGLFDRTSLALLVLGCIPAGMLWFWGVPWFRVVFGANWALAGAIAAMVAPWYLAQFVVSPLSRVVAVFSGQETKLIWDLLSLASLVAVFAIAHGLGFAPLETIRMLTVTNTVLYIIYYLVLVRIIRQVPQRAPSTLEAGE